MTDAATPDPIDQAGPSAANFAADSSQVGAQIGFVAGDVQMYEVSEGQDREATYKVALNFLNGSSGSRAATLIREAVAAGLGTDGATAPNDIAYHWVLAILSGRSYEQLGPDDFADIDHARGMADRQQPDDDLLQAHDFMYKLLEGRRRQAESDAADPDFRELLADYRSLTSRPSSATVNFAEDFDRHLDLMLVGGIEDQAAAEMADRARVGRIRNERTQRAWKYFEPEPVPPRLRTTTEPAFPIGRKILAGLAATLGLAGAVLALAVLQERGVLRTVLLAVIIALAAVVTVRSRISYLAAMERIADKDDDFGQRHLGRYASHLQFYAESGEVGLPDEPNDEAAAEKTRQDNARRAKFVRMLSIHLNDQFAQRAPRVPSTRRKWDADTAGLKVSVKRHLLAQYHEPELVPGGLNWLVALRVREIAEMQREGTLRKYQERMAPRARDVFGFALGVFVSVVACGYVLFLILTKNAAVAALAAATLALAVFVEVQSRIDVYRVERRRLDADRQEAAARLKIEEAEYQSWVEKLEDRPTDDVMARWLDYDKIHLRRLAMTQLGLSTRDVLMHTTVTEPAARCVLVRMPFGPPRYSVYRVTVLLLTKAGVRLVRMTLDFRTGEVYNQFRYSFRYDVITSASATETGVRYDTGRREVMRTPQNPWTLGQEGSEAAARQDELRRSITEGSAILSQDFVLSLRGGERITFLVENLAAAVNDRSKEDPISLLDLALETSGLAVALEILEDISGDGSQWVEDRVRRRRRTRFGLHVAGPPDSDLRDEGPANGQGNQG
ncbi:MAG TPA: hypothetical protein VGI66_00360 [Streptosporangiaceae bacterium]